MKVGSLVSAVLVLFAAACSSSTTPSTSGTGTSGQKLAVGSPCTGDSDCGSSPFFCMQGDHVGGYCMRNCDIKNGDADCPSEAICQFDGTAGECHKKCGGQSDCRTGYVCAPASSSSTDTASGSYCDMPGMAGMGDGGMKMDAGMSMDAGMDMDGMSSHDTGMPTNMDGSMNMDM